MAKWDWADKRSGNKKNYYIYFLFWGIDNFKFILVILTWSINTDKIFPRTRKQE